MRRKPHARFIFTARDKSKINKGIMNEEAIISFVKKVVAVASHITFLLFRFDDSSEIWMPSASENASAIAIVRIPPITTSFIPVPTFSPTIKPKVVIIPEVSPKLTPVFIDSFIRVYVKNVYKVYWLKINSI